MNQIDPRAPACVDCDLCTKKARNLRNYSHECGLHGDPYAARARGGVCGPEGKDWVPKRGAKKVIAPL